MKLKGYEKYQLEWMIQHGYSLKDLIDELERLRSDLVEMEKEDGIHIDLNILDLFTNWEYEIGFNSEIWVCKEEWEDCDGE